MAQRTSSQSKRMLGAGQMVVKALVKEPVKEAVREALVEDRMHHNTKADDERRSDDDDSEGGGLLSLKVLLPLALLVAVAIYAKRWGGDELDLGGTEHPIERGGEAGSGGIDEEASPRS